MVARFRSLTSLVVAAVVAGMACPSSPAKPARTDAVERTVAFEPPARKEARTGSVDALMEDIERRTFQWFWDTADPVSGLTPDRAPTPSFSSIAAVGFGLTAYTIGAERGYVPRADAAARTRDTLQFLLDLPQGPGATGVAGYNGFFYHFLDMRTGLRYRTVELSSVDTSLLMAGVLACAAYFDGSSPDETAVRDLARQLYERVDWTFFLNHPPAISLGWTPEDGFNSYDWRGYDESMIVYVLALGSPSHPIDPSAWDAWTSTYVWARFKGQDFLQFAPLFGHQYSHVWIDFRGIQDAFMRGHGIDYFENSRRATYAQRSYAIANPSGFKGYGSVRWGLTACDGPGDMTLTVDGVSRRFYGYAARGASVDDTRDDGTIAPTAAVASLPFAPALVVPAVREMAQRYGTELYGPYGFKDAFNPTFPSTAFPQAGHVVPGVGWFDGDSLGIDQGPIVAMIENERSGFVWALGRKTPAIVSGLRRAGFTGGWLDAASP
jgi:hypothetical protein